jgi:hypothetical protein
VQVSGSSAFQSSSLRKSQWLALAQPDAAGDNPVGTAGVGFAFSHGAGTFGTILPRQQRRLIEISSDTAIWYHSGQPPLPIRWVIVCDPKNIFKTQALLCTDVNISAEQIIHWFVRHWQVEVTFHEVRTHLGVETQRKWADLSILRSTPALLGLFSVVTLLANLHAKKQYMPVYQTAWYPKQLPTFSDTLSLVKQTLFSASYFRTSLFPLKSKNQPARVRITTFPALQIPFSFIKRTKSSSGRVTEGSLDAMKSVNELGLLLLGEHCQPCFLILMHKQTEIMSNLVASVGQFDEKHPPVG